MKRSPLQRNTPLARSKPLRKRAARRISSMTVEDRLFLAWLHDQPCYGRDLIIGHICEGPIQQAHLRSHTGLGLKEPVQSSAPLCRAAHSQYDEHRGAFRSWTKETRRVWMLAAVAMAQAAFRMWMDGRAAA